MKPEYADFADSMKSELPHIVSRNADYIYRNMYREEGSRKEGQSKKGKKILGICRSGINKYRSDGTSGLVSSIVRKLYFPSNGYYNRVLRRDNRKFSIGDSDVIVIFSPYRDDYKELLYPIANYLADSGLHVTVFFPRKDKLSEEVLNFFDVNQVVFGNELLKYQDILYSKREFQCLSEEIEELFNDFNIDPGKANSYFKKMVLDTVIMKRLMIMMSPDIVYGIHFMTRPGYLSALSEYSDAEIILIQHGIMPPQEGFHDFKGADEVMMWGKKGKSELKKIDSNGNLSVPRSKVMGNPKLEQIRNAHWFNDCVRENDGEIVVLYASSAGKAAKIDYARQSAQLFTDSVNDLQVPITVRYKPHPGNASDYQKILGIDIDSSEIKDSCSIYKLISMADIVVGTESTVMVEAIALDTPAIQLLPSVSETDLTKEGLIGVDTHSELQNELQLIATETTYRQEMLEKEKSVAEKYFSMNSIENPSNEITSYLKNKLT